MFYDSASAPSSTKLSERASMGTNGHAPSVPYPLASECAAFIDRAPTPFHCCAEAARQLVEAGFTELAEDESWSGALKPGGTLETPRDENGCAHLAGRALQETYVRK